MKLFHSQCLSHWLNLDSEKPCGQRYQKFALLKIGLSQCLIAIIIIFLSEGKACLCFQILKKYANSESFYGW